MASSRKRSRADASYEAHLARVCEAGRLADYESYREAQPPVPWDEEDAAADAAGAVATTPSQRSHEFQELVELTLEGQISARTLQRTTPEFQVCRP